jgi:predicted ester cyclase
MRRNVDIDVRTAGADPVIGIDAYRATMEGSFAGFPDLHLEVDDRFATDEQSPTELDRA